MKNEKYPDPPSNYRGFSRITTRAHARNYRGFSRITTQGAARNYCGFSRITTQGGHKARPYYRAEGA